MKKALTHNTWQQALRALAESHGDDTVRDLARFGENVLDKCESTEELAAYLDREASVILEAR